MIEFTRCSGFWFEMNGNGDFLAHLLVAIVYFHLVVAADEGFVGTQAGLNIGEAIHISNLIFYFCCDIGVGDDQSA